MSEYEPFSIYGFCTVYPVAWKIELNPESDRSQGNVAFKSPEKENIFLIWGSLEKAKKAYSSLEEHAEDPLKRLKNNPRVKEVDLVQRKLIQVNSHEAIFSHVKVILSSPSLLPFRKAKKYEREVRCMHVYCEPSGRYFLVYGEISSDKSLEQYKVLENMINSFICHKTEANSTAP
jgi:hypothetical protein